MDKIIIKDLEVDAHIGVTEAERVHPQRLLITVEMERDLYRSGTQGFAETSTTPYDVVTDMIRKVVTERPRKLVEAVAHEIAGSILTHQMANAVNVEVKKFSIPRSQYVSIQIRRTDKKAMRTCCWLILAFVCSPGFAPAPTPSSSRTAPRWRVRSSLKTIRRFQSCSSSPAGRSHKHAISISRTSPSVTHWTPEQKAQRYSNTITRTCKSINSIQPPVTRSLYYDQVINNAFRKFLNDHPNSPTRPISLTAPRNGSPNATSSMPVRRNTRDDGCPLPRSITSAAGNGCKKAAPRWRGAIPTSPSSNSVPFLF